MKDFNLKNFRNCWKLLPVIVALLTLPGLATLPVEARTLSQAAEAPLINWEYDQLRPAAAYNSQVDNYLVVWEDHHWGWGEARDIYGQRVKADGTLLGNNLGLAWESANHCENPDVTYNAAVDEYQVAWEFEYSTTDHDVFYRRIGPDGIPLEVWQPVSAHGSYEGQPAVVAAEEGLGLVVWEDGRNLDSQGINLYVRAMNSGLPSVYLPLVMKAPS